MIVCLCFCGFISSCVSSALRNGDEPKKEVDITRDWNLERKAMSEESLRRPTALCAALAMSASLSAKVVASIVIFRILVPTALKLRTAMKAATTEFHTALKSIPRETKKDLPPPFAMVAEALISEAHEMGCKHLPAENPDRLHLSLFYNRMMECEPTERICLIMEGLRFVRARNTWDKKFSMIEIGLSPIAAESTKLWFKALRRTLVTYEAGIEKMGVAPKTAIECRIEKILHELNVWR